MKADFHMHSVYSDGVYTPRELARRARQVGLEIFSITDHDTLAGDDDKQKAMAEFGYPFLRGWEISTVSDRKVHILGYSCNICDPYEEFLQKRREEAADRIVEILKKSNEYFGAHVTMEDVERESYAPNNVLHSIYAIRVYAKLKGCNDMDLFHELYSKNKPLYTAPRRPKPIEAIECIHAMGGVAVLAHPGRMREEGKKELMEELVRQGIDGIECYYTTHTESETEDYLAFARRNKLYITGGSDYHFENGKPVFGKPDYEADENFLARVLPSQGGVSCI